eukprot:Nk52_evm11s156 gene=Nk52_evmTU11s156
MSILATKDSLIKGVFEEFYKDKHIEYLRSYGKENHLYEYGVTEHLRMGGLYWTCTAMGLCGALELMDREGIVAFVQASWDQESGGFGAAPGHDAHLLHTLSAVQIAAIYDEYDKINIDKIVGFVKSLQLPDGSFKGDLSEAIEIDSRFSFCAIHCLSLLGRLHEVDVEQAVEFILKCQNFDCGFGCVPGSESHAAQIYCCVGTLAIAGQLHRIDVDKLGWWLCERQLPSGGLNGRPEKLPDVCYSWWVLSCLKVIGRMHWIDKGALKNFILAAQDEEEGGISDRIGDISDPFHTLFGIAGLSLMGFFQLEEIDPVYCLPAKVIRRLGINSHLEK